MDGYNIYFEVAALFFLVFIMIMLKIKRQLNIFKNRLFFAELIAIFWLNVVDIISAVLIDYKDLLQDDRIWLYVTYGVTMLTYLLQQVAIMLFLLYISTFLKLKKTRNVIFRIFGTLSVLYAALVISTPFTKLVFYFDENRMYQYGKLHAVYYLIPVACGICTITLMLVKWHRFSLIEKRIFAFFCLSTFLVTGIQVILLPTYLITYFWMSIALVALFFSLQSPDYYIDRTTSAFNSDGLTVMLNDRIDRQKSFSVLLMSVYDFEGLEGGFSTQNKRMVYKQLCSMLIQGQKGKDASGKKKSANGQTLHLYGKRKKKGRYEHEDGF